jgi:hypothetical protein
MKLSDARQGLWRGIGLVNRSSRFHLWAQHCRCDAGEDQFGGVFLMFGVITVFAAVILAIFAIDTRGRVL